jgi:bacterioferritin-associated ferredoxin
LVDYRSSADRPLVSIPYEFSSEQVGVGSWVTVADTEGEVLGRVEVAEVRPAVRKGQTTVIKVAAPPAIADRIAGIRIRDDEPLWYEAESVDEGLDPLRDDAFVCRCERVTAGEIRTLIRDGCRDLNALKAATRIGMGPCGGKTCTPLVLGLFREAGIPLDAVTEGTHRPLFVEVPLEVFAGADSDAEGEGV